MVMVEQWVTTRQGSDSEGGDGDNGSTVCIRLFTFETAEGGESI